MSAYSVVSGGFLLTFSVARWRAFLLDGFLRRAVRAVFAIRHADNIRAA